MIMSASSSRISSFRAVRVEAGLSVGGGYIGLCLDGAAVVVGRRLVHTCWSC